MNMNEYAESSAWLKADMLEEPIKTEIKDVYEAPSNFGGKQIVLECEDFKYSMRIGHPNIKRLIDSLGDNSEDWKGRSVEFSAEDYTDKDGNLKSAIVCIGVSVVKGKTPRQVNEQLAPNQGSIPPPPKPNMDFDDDLGF